MARKSKKTKRAINWTAVVWTVLIVNVLVGLMFSPITSVRHLRVLGAQPHDLQRIDSLAEALRGRPFARVGALQLESAVLGQRDVYNAKLTHNLFGSAILTVKYRTPIAVMANDPHIFLDREGVIFGSPEANEGLRKVDLDPDYAQPGVALTLPWPSQDVADLCTKLDSFDQLKDAAVHLDTTGRLLIVREDKHTVDLGGTGQIDEKLAKLKGILEEDPNLLDKVASLSLADPAHPAYKQLKGNTQ